MCLIKRGFESAEVLLHACVGETRRFIRKYSPESKKLTISKASVLLQDTNRFEEKQIFWLLILCHKAASEQSEKFLLLLQVSH